MDPKKTYIYMNCYSSSFQKKCFVTKRSSCSCILQSEGETCTFWYCTIGKLEEKTFLTGQTSWKSSEQKVRGQIRRGKCSRTSLPAKEFLLENHYDQDFLIISFGAILYLPYKSATIDTHLNSNFEGDKLIIINLSSRRKPSTSPFITSS